MGAPLEEVEEVAQAIQASVMEEREPQGEVEPPGVQGRMEVQGECREGEDANRNATRVHRVDPEGCLVEGE